MFCMNCGSKIPDGAKFCMNCGTQIGTVNSEEISIPQEKTEKEEIKEEKYVVFNLLNDVQIQYIEDTKYIAKYYGTFVSMMNEMALNLEQYYKSAGGMKNVVLNMEQAFHNNVDAVVSKACDVLNENDIYDIGRTQFIRSYMSDFYDMYRENLNSVFEAYSAILEDRDNMAEYRDWQKASRGRWVGGGFGMKGAIKGSVQASLMNAGSDLFHGIGDNIREASDNAEMNKKLKELYESYWVKNLLCNEPRYVVIAIYNIVSEILIERLQLSRNVFRVDIESADVLYDDTLKSNAPDEKKRENYIKCIQMNPMKPEFYQVIIDDIVLQEKDSEYDKFLQFWGIDNQFLHLMISECRQEYEEQKTSFLEYQIEEKRSCGAFSKWINAVNKKLKQLDRLQYYFARFDDMGAKNNHVANEENNVALLNKAKIYLQKTDNYTDQIIVYIDNGWMIKTGSNGIAIGTNEIFFISSTKVRHLLYSDIKCIGYGKIEKCFIFNKDNDLKWKVDTLAYEDNITLMTFILLKVKSKNVTQGKIHLYIY